jgi:iron complex transport system permease protein
VTSVTVAGPDRSLRRRRAIGLTVCVAALVAAVVLSLALGARPVPWADVIAGLFDPDPGEIAHAAVRQRIPRTIVGLVVGAALGLAGGVMQGVTRNPLADPGILGVNAGAAMATVVAIALLGIDHVTQYVWFAFLGAGLAAMAVYVIGSLGREGATPLKLALAGAAISAVASATISMILLTRIDVLNVFRFWQLGSLGRADLSQLALVSPFFLVGCIVGIASARGMDALALGDDMAAGLGMRVNWIRIAGAVAAVLLCGTATALAGPIGFVGLTMAHLARMVTGPNYRWILPYAAGFGAVLLVVADVAGRVVARPEMLDVGIMTAFIGAPVFIAIVRRQKVREL